MDYYKVTSKSQSSHYPVTTQSLPVNQNARPPKDNLPSPSYEPLGARSISIKTLNLVFESKANLLRWLGNFTYSTYKLKVTVSTRDSLVNWNVTDSLLSNLKVTNSKLLKISNFLTSFCAQESGRIMRNSIRQIIFLQKILPERWRQSNRSLEGRPQFPVFLLHFKLILVFLTFRSNLEVTQQKFFEATLSCNFISNLTLRTRSKVRKGCSERVLPTKRCAFDTRNDASN